MIHVLFVIPEGKGLFLLFSLVNFRQVQNLVVLHIALYRNEIILDLLRLNTVRNRMLPSLFINSLY